MNYQIKGSKFKFNDVWTPIGVLLLYVKTNKSL